MSEEKTVVELLTIAQMAAHINRLAVETKPPAWAVAELAREITEEALKRAKALLAQDEGENDTAPGE